MLTGQLPFQLLPNQRPKNLYSKICRADFRFPDERVRVQTRPAGAQGAAENDPFAKAATRISDSAKDLVRKILAPNPARRLTSNGIWQHPWMAGSMGPGLHDRLGSDTLEQSLSRSSSVSGRSGTLSRGSSVMLTPATTPVWPVGGMSSSPLPVSPGP